MKNKKEFVEQENTVTLSIEDARAEKHRIMFLCLFDGALFMGAGLILISSIPIIISNGFVGWEPYPIIFVNALLIYFVRNAFYNLKREFRTVLLSINNGQKTDK